MIAVTFVVCYFQVGSMEEKLKAIIFFLLYSLLLLEPPSWKCVHFHSRGRTPLFCLVINMWPFFSGYFLLSRNRLSVPWSTEQLDVQDNFRIHFGHMMVVADFICVPQRKRLRAHVGCPCCRLQACAGRERELQQARLGSMGKAQKSNVRKSSHCLRREVLEEGKKTERKSQAQRFPTRQINKQALE